MFEPKFSISNAILNYVGKIESAKAVVDTAPLIPAWEKTFRDDATLRAVHYGTHLEGNDLSLGQAKLIFENLDKEDMDRPAQQIANKTGVVARDRDIQEVMNYRKVLDYLETLRENTQRYTRYLEEEILAMHRLTVDKMLIPEQAGLYRTSKVVVKDAMTGQISYRPPNPVEIPYQIEHFLEWLNSFVSKDIHPVLRAGITHFELVRIHPFVDGNGRVSRALATLVLFREGYDIKRLFSLEEYYDNNLAHYYQALQSVHLADGDLTQWLEFFTLGLAVELDKIKEKVRELSLDERMLNRLGQQISLTQRQIRLVEFMREHEAMYMKDAVKMIPLVSEDTLLRELKGLMEKNLVEKRGRTKGAYYSLKTK